MNRVCFICLRKLMFTYSFLLFDIMMCFCSDLSIIETKDNFWSLSLTNFVEAGVFGCGAHNSLAHLAFSLRSTYNVCFLLSPALDVVCKLNPTINPAHDSPLVEWEDHTHNSKGSSPSKKWLDVLRGSFPALQIHCTTSSNNMQYHAIKLNSIQCDVILCNTMNYHAKQWNTMKHNWIQNNAMQ